MMYSGDELYPDDVTSGILDPVPAPRRELVSIEATCASCGDQCVVPGDEDPEDTLCAACAGDRDEGVDDLDDEPELDREGQPEFNGAF